MLVGVAQQGGPVYPVNQPRPVSVPPPTDAQQRTRRVEAVPGTAFGIVHLEVPPATSGLAVGGLIAGIASIVVSFVVLCFGLVGAQDGWGAWAAGAFTVLAVSAGVAGVALGILGRRQIRQVGPAASMRFQGKGLASAGFICGIVGLVIALLAFFAAVGLQVAA
ncbi:hypothetical protein SAMN05421684_1050 [Asanoa ishikariensis]|uniref:DUF4190 domain-containing protein n=1 Tax=Asanoa ishikariensis TaxID=137265 RepID=A0A1H3LXX8_9ACTN|nr:hypothetical protein SAMN05421684_1050 [Asanoa ishikariensis]